MGDGYSQTSNADKLVNKRILPAIVEQLECKPLLGKSQPVLQISWTQPWNVQYLQYSNIQYEVLLQDADLNTIQKWNLKTTVHQFMEGISADEKYFVWVRTVVDGNMYGPYNIEVTCHT